MIRVLLLSIIMSTCAANKSTSTIESITLSTRTRGFEKTITINSKLRTTYINRRGEENTTAMATTSEEWEVLTACLQAVPLTRLADLSSDPSDISVDRSAMTTVTVMLSDGTTYESGTLDMGKLPNELNCLSDL